MSKGDINSKSNSFKAVLSNNISCFLGSYSIAMYILLPDFNSNLAFKSFKKECICGIDVAILS
jgi:hypothetical protein